MLTIANNITTRNPRIAAILKERVTGDENPDVEACPGLKDVAEACVGAGADVLEVNLQQRMDDPETMELAVKVIQQATDHQFCLSANRADTLEAGLRLCRRPPIVNYTALDTERLEKMLPLAVKYKAEVVLLISDPSVPADSRQMLEKAAILVGAANEAGIPNERILLDPGLFHITKEAGQHHLLDIIELLQAIPETFDPQIRTTCWLSNSSADAPTRLRPVIETTLLAMLSGMGLSSVFLDILRKENRRVLRLLKIFHNEEIYADSLLTV